MKSQRVTLFRLRLASILMSLVLLASPTSLLAAECEVWIAQILSAQGKVEVIRSGASRAVSVSSGETKLCPGDTLRAGALSKATLLLANQTRATIDEATEFTLPQVDSSNANCRRPGASNRPLVEILKGAMRFISRTPTSLEICAPYVNAAIEGTEFVVRAKTAENYVWVSEGRVLASNAQGSLSLKPGEGVVALAGSPLRRITVKPEDATQWSLYYPPVIDYRAEVYSRGPNAPTIANAIADYRKSDLAAAFGQLEEVPEAARNAEYYSLRAGLLLSAGRVEEALADTKRALRIDPAQGIAYALQSIVAVTQNKVDAALTLAQRAQQLEPESSVPEIALSYAYQAKFDIEKARNSVRKAVELSPEDALAWSRLAELELSLGDLDEALAAAEKAEKLDTQLSRTQTVLGFAHLTQIDIGEAKTAFRKAIDFDPAAPLPHLGLGLATIRQGDLDEGTKEIETAAILDPDNALIRSYLGKAYYEQKRGGLATSELNIAKELDPNDPTPWFYDAIRKQTTNRPVEALHDLQKAIELNANRAVYRSSLLLDQDEAARSASLGRIYNDLGFQQLGLVEGWKSVNTDPGNHSAHRLLADSYAALPRHEIARVSELLQSQLLQPINITPVQAQLAESNLLILDGLGPADPSFNEFNPLFTRNRFALQTSGVYGSNDTWGDEVTQSGLWNKFSYSLGQFHFETDGFRENNDLKHDVYNLFTQVAVTSNINLQAEYRRRQSDQGDLKLNFDSPFLPNIERRSIDQDTARIGAKFSPSPRSDILLSLVQGNRDEVVGNLVDSRKTLSKIDGYDAQIQYQYRTDQFNLIAGTGTYDLNDKLVFLDFPFPDFDLNLDSKNYYGYLYVDIKWPKNLIWTFGFSHDSVEIGELDLQETDPKVGLQWNVTDAMLIRLAYTETLKRALVADQTLERTNVAGFNQLFDDFTGTQAKRYGIGLDTRLGKTVYSGIELSRRDLSLPRLAITPQDATAENLFEDQKEDLYRGYIYWVPHPRWAFSAEYQLEKFRRTQLSELPFAIPTKVKTTSVPIALRFFSPMGFFSEIATTCVRQKVDVVTATSVTPESENFTVIDVSVGYRLPKRRGIITLTAKNLQDKDFMFQDHNIQSFSPSSPEFVPDRSIVVQLILNF